MPGEYGITRNDARQIVVDARLLNVQVGKNFDEHAILDRPLSRVPRASRQNEHQHKYDEREPCHAPQRVATCWVSSATTSSAERMVFALLYIYRRTSHLPHST